MPITAPFPVPSEKAPALPRAPEPGQMGIYQWTVWRNDAPALVYVGQSVRLAGRKQDYLNELAGLPAMFSGNNDTLMEALRKYGTDVSEFDVLELVEDRDALTNREKWWYRDRVVRFGRRNVANKVEPRPTKYDLERQDKGTKRRRKGSRREPAVRELTLEQLRREERQGRHLSSTERERLWQAENAEARSKAPARKPTGRPGEFLGIKSPTGTVFDRNCPWASISRVYKVSAKKIEDLVAGKIAEYRGWTRLVA